MDCSQFYELLHDLDRPGTEAFAVREIALAHAGSCARCALLLTHSESLDKAFRAILQEDATRQAPTRVETLLLREFRCVKAIRSRDAWSWRRLAAMGIAAALILASGVALRYSNSPASGPAANDFQQKASASGRDASAKETAGQNVANLSQADDSALATEFVPLPYADDSTAGEEGAIVRVTLSRTALASLGLPVTDIGASDRIPADIVVSEDGAPQAIRLVAQSQLEQ